jgi:hypothetical protein
MTKRSSSAVASRRVADPPVNRLLGLFYGVSKKEFDRLHGNRAAR